VHVESWSSIVKKQLFLLVVNKYLLKEIYVLYLILLCVRERETE